MPSAARRRDDLTGRERVRELCSRIREMDRQLDATDSALVALLGGDVNPGDQEADRLSRDQGVAGCAWALHGSIETGSWADMVRNAAALLAALG